MHTILIILLSFTAWQSIQTDIQNLKSPDQHIRWHAARNLRERGPAPKARIAIQALTQATEKDPSIDVRVEAVLALGSIGKAYPDAVDALMGLVSDKRNQLNQWAVIALGDAGPGAKNAVGRILEYLKSASNSEQIFDSLETLGKIGPSAKQAIPIIEKYLNNSNIAPERGEIKTAAKRAIQRISQR